MILPSIWKMMEKEEMVQTTNQLMIGDIYFFVISPMLATEKDGFGAWDGHIQSLRGVEGLSLEEVEVVPHMDWDLYYLYL